MGRFHTAAYNTTITVADGLKAIPTITDTIFPPSGNGYLPPTDLRLIAAYAGSFQISRARINAPSLMRVGYPSIRPVQQAASTGLSATPAADPNLMTLLDSPVLIRASESVGVDGATASGTTDRIIALLWFADQLEPVPPGDSFWLRFTSSTTLTAQAWTVVTPSFDQAFPAGVYSVTGLEFTSPGAVAARIIFPGSIMRPGVLAQVGSIASTTAGAARTHACFYDGSLGVFGTFQTSAPPSIEVLSITADAGNTQEGYLRVVRIGDTGACPPMPTGPASASHGSSLARASTSSLAHASGASKGR